MKYQGNDWLVELNNMLTKVNNYLLLAVDVTNNSAFTTKGIYGGHGSNNTVDRVIKESVLIQLFRDIITIIEKQFGINPKLTRHGEPNMTATYEELGRLMRESGVFTCKEGRKTAHLIRDAFEDGMLKFATENSAQTAEILINSNEMEQAVTEEDVIMETP